MILFNPTGGTIRNDTAGSGYWLAQRGSRLHQGIDFTLPGGPGQLVLSPITGVLKRIAYPYSDDQEIRGCEIRGDVWIKMFYFRPYDSLVGQRIAMGQPIGTAQDVTERYPGQGMTPHIHLEVITINPAILF